MITPAVSESVFRWKPFVLRQVIRRGGGVALDRDRRDPRVRSARERAHTARAIVGSEGMQRRAAPDFSPPPPRREEPALTLQDRVALVNLKRSLKGGSKRIRQEPGLRLGFLRMHRQAHHPLPILPLRAAGKPDEFPAAGILQPIQGEKPGLGRHEFGERSRSRPNGPLRAGLGTGPGLVRNLALLSYPVWKIP